METILALIDGFGDDPVVTLAVLGLAGGALAAYVVFGFARDRQDLRRRAAAGTDIPEPARAPRKARAAADRSSGSSPSSTRTSPATRVRTGCSGAS